MEHCAFCGTDHRSTEARYIPETWHCYFCSDECMHAFFEEFSTYDDAVAALKQHIENNTNYRDIPF